MLIFGGVCQIYSPLCLFSLSLEDIVSPLGSGSAKMGYFNTTKEEVLVLTSDGGIIPWDF